MPRTLRVKDLKIGHVYREPLSGHRMRVRQIAMYPGARPYKAECLYYSAVLGRYILVWLYDGELEDIVPNNDE